MTGEPPLVDRWGDEIAGSRASVAAWDDAWDQFVRFRGDPLGALADANADDPTFVMGSVLTGLYLVLAGVRLDDARLGALRATAIERATTGRDAAHAAALSTMIAGEFTAAADEWDAIARERDDFAATRFAHDVHLHVGDARRRLASTSGAVARRPPGAPGWNLVAGMHAFALEERGRFADAEAVGRTALDADPHDLWARHALAHVYEETDDTASAMALLSDDVDVWSDCDLLAVHLWWHLALRLLATGDVDGLVRIFDEQAPVATTPFRLCDLTSLLWRAELAGHRVGGDRWSLVADRWAAVAERHTCGFLDLHATLAFVRRPGHPGADRWFEGLADRPRGDAEIDHVFRDVVEPLVAAFRMRAAGDPTPFLDTIERIADDLARIGGSNAQRALLTLTKEAT